MGGERTADKLLEVNGLSVAIDGKDVLRDVSFSVAAGTVTSLVGESSSGKTMTALAVLRLLPSGAVMKKGSVRFRGGDIPALGPSGLRELRGGKIAMVFQEPFTALNPVLSAAEHLKETIEAHGVSQRDVPGGGMEGLLGMVRLGDDVLKAYPHELSGGMRQRLMLAMALSCRPELLILDEPTTALDVSIQKVILGLISDIRKESGLTILFITHDFSVVNMIADEVCVMREGAVVEKGTTRDILHSPRHPYTRMLISCIPRLGDSRERLPE